MNYVSPNSNIFCKVQVIPSSKEYFNQRAIHQYIILFINLINVTGLDKLTKATNFRK